MKNINQLGEDILVQAIEKGWGHIKDEVSVSRKMMLINTEITELYKAIVESKKPVSPKDTVESELADIVIRTIHLGKVWEVDFDQIIEYSKYNFDSNSLIEKTLFYFHTLASETFEFYRCKNFEKFKTNLIILIFELIRLSEFLEIDITESIYNKLQINNTRVWKH